MRGLLLAALGIVGLYVAGGALLFLVQRHLIYPTWLLGGRAGAPPQGFAAVAITTPDGVALRAWRAPSAYGKPTILHLHGNAETLEALASRLRAYASRGYGVFAVQFRGYPGSAGSPGETGLIADARAALDWLAANGTPPASVVVYGRSLGSGPAVALASERETGPVVLEAPFTSILDIARKQFPIYPATLLLRDPFRSDARIGRVRQPLLIAHGARDDVVAPEMSEPLLALAGSARKQRILVPVAGHNDLDEFGLVDMVDRFLSETVRP